MEEGLKNVVVDFTVNEDKLKEAYAEAHPDADYNLSDAIKCELGWLLQSGMTINNLAIIDNTDNVL